MAFITVDEIVAELTALGVRTSARTVNRQLAHLKKTDAKNYAANTGKDGKRIVYQKSIIVPYCRDFDQHKNAAPATPAKAAKRPTPKPAQLKESAKPAEPVKRRQYREPAPETDNLQEALLSEPVIFFTPDAEARAAFEKFTTPAARLRYELSISVCAQYALGIDTLEYCCLKYGVPARTFHEWKAAIAEIAHLYKKARVARRKARNDMFREAAEDSLFKMVTGWEYTQHQVTYEERLEPDGSVTRVPKERREINKVMAPSLGAIVYALNNRAPQRWKNQQHIVAAQSDSGKPAQADDYANMSDAELFGMLKELMASNPDALNQFLLLNESPQ